MNIFIAGLNYNMSEAELGELFAEYGEVVSVKIIMDRETGRSKGYGFVEMADDEAGDKAIAALNEVDMDGKTLSVSVARPREERPRRSYGNNGGGGYRGGNNSRGGGYTTNTQTPSIGTVIRNEYGMIVLANQTNRNITFVSSCSIDLFVL